MKRVLFGLVAALIVSAMVMPTAALAADAYSSIQVLNLGTAAAEINISYYDQNGALVTLPGGLSNPVPDTVAVGESNTYFPVHTADGFNGSVVIESTEPIAVISNILYTSTPMAQSSWVGFEQTGTELRFPLIMKGNNSNDTTFNVQNTTSASVQVLIEFSPEPGGGYGAIASVTDNIPAWAAHTFDQRTMSQFSGVTKWVGSAKVTVQGAGAIAGVAQQLDSARNTATAYNGFLGGSPTVEAPLIMTANNNMWTSINCQNLGAGNTDVTVAYTPESGYAAKPNDTKTAVVPNGTAVFLNYGTTKWVGAATITNSASNDLACVINQNNLVTFYASAYEGFDGSVASDTAVAPFVQYQPQSGGNLYSSINVKNLSGSTATITVDFKPGPGFGDPTTLSKPNVAAGAVAVFIIYEPLGAGVKYLGGAEIHSDAGNIGVVINQGKLGYTGDVYSSYDAFVK
jgi:hypothetical protein